MRKYRDFYLVDSRSEKHCKHEENKYTSYSKPEWTEEHSNMYIFDFLKLCCCFNSSSFCISKVKSEVLLVHFSFHNKIRKVDQLYKGKGLI